MNHERRKSIKGLRSLTLFMVLVLILRYWLLDHMILCVAVDSGTVFWLGWIHKKHERG